jgi:uncharacterized DUF497 family protein
MDVSYRLSGIHFVWDHGKAQINLQKHGVTLESACEVFFDPFVRLLRTERIGEEDRDVVIGLTQAWELLIVVHTFREDVIRIISARPATSPERKAYEDE